MLCALLTGLATWVPIWVSCQPVSFRISPFSGCTLVVKPLHDATNQQLLFSKGNTNRATNQQHLMLANSSFSQMHHDHCNACIRAKFTFRCSCGIVPLPRITFRHVLHLLQCPSVNERRYGGKPIDDIGIELRQCPNRHRRPPSQHGVHAQL